MKKIRNSVNLTGKAGTDPVIVEFTGGKKLGKVAIAINESYKTESGESAKRTHWFNLVFWNDKVALVENILTKGAEISIKGKLTTSEYTDKSGEKRYSTEIVVFEVLEISPTKES